MSDTSIIKLPSRFDFNHHKLFNAQVDEVFAVAGNKKLVLDFSQVQYLDSAALGLLVLLSKQNTEKGSKLQITIKGAQGTAKEILEIANMSKLYSYE